MVLNGWKEIAKHLGCGVRTAQRWEQLGLKIPIHRPKLGSGPVCAFPEDLDEWLRSTPRRVLTAAEEKEAPAGLPSGFKHRVLVVDDEEKQRTNLAAILGDAGYEVRTASDGFHAIAVVREGGVPDLIVSDLRMPNMSGFELLSVIRKRFPAVLVIAVSGDFKPAAPPDALADAYLPKDEGIAETLRETARELLESPPIRTHLAKCKQPATWIPISEADYVVVTCTQCLRSFSIPAAEVENSGDAELVFACVHCDVPVHFHIDRSSAPGKRLDSEG